MIPGSLTAQREVERLTAENTALRATVARVEALHRPVDVPGIPGTSLVGFTKCSCTPGSLYAECPTVQALVIGRRAR